MNKRISKLQIFRFITQVIFLILIPGLFTLTFDGLKQAYLSVIKGDFNFVRLIPQLIEAIAVIPLTVLLGRFFCGWFCAFGSFSDFVYIISSKVFKTKYKINPKLNSILKYLKYCILLLIIILIWTKDNRSLNILSPWNAFAQIGELPQALLQYLPGFIVLAFVAAGAMFVERFFCRYLCPLGAIFSVISRVRLFKIDKPAAACGKCRICTNSCPAGIELYKMEKVNSGECINCLKCIQACPRKNPQASICNAKLNSALAGAFAITAFTSLYSVSNLLSSSANMYGAIVEPSSSNSNISLSDNTSSDSNNPQIENNNTATQNNNITTQNSSQSDVSNPNPPQQRKYNDGTYAGVGRGHRPGLEVSVEIKDDKIINIEILSSRETPRYTRMPFQIVPGEIMQIQSTNVDAVSGATETSEGIKEAVADALNQATI